MWRLMVSGWLAFQAVSPEILQHVQAGLRAKQEGRLDAAIAEFQKVTQLEPTSALAFMSLGAVYVQKREYGNAIPALRRTLEVQPELAAAHELLGYALLAQGYAADAIPHLERVQAPGALGIALLQTGRLREALAQLEAALAKQPDDPDLLFYLGQVCAELVKQTFEGIVSAYPDSPRAHQIRG